MYLEQWRCQTFKDFWLHSRALLLLYLDSILSVRSTKIYPKIVYISPKIICHCCWIQWLITDAHTTSPWLAGCPHFRGCNIQPSVGMLILIRSRLTSKKALTDLNWQALSIYLVFKRWFLESASLETWRSYSERWRSSHWAGLQVYPQQNHGEWKEVLGGVPRGVAQLGSYQWSYTADEGPQSCNWWCWSSSGGSRAQPCYTVIYPIIKIMCISLIHTHLAPFRHFGIKTIWDSIFWKWFNDTGKNHG